MLFEGLNFIKFLFHSLRSMTSNLLNAFVAPSISSESSKDDRHGNDHLAKKVGEGDHYEPRVAFSNHLAHQPSTSSQLKFNRQAEETSNNSLRHHLLSSTSSLLLNDMHRDTSQRRGNGEVVYPPRRQDYSFANEKPDFATLNSGKDSFQKRGVPVSPQSLSKSTSFPIMTTFPEVVSTGGNCLYFLLLFYLLTGIFIVSFVLLTATCRWTSLDSSELCPTQQRLLVQPLCKQDVSS